MANPLIDRYYDPLGARLDYDEKKVEAARQEAIENVKAKLAAATNEDEKRELQMTLRKLGVSAVAVRELAAAR